jgi:hypothetical protein
MYALILFILFASLSACAGRNGETEPTVTPITMPTAAPTPTPTPTPPAQTDEHTDITTASGEVVISFDFVHQSGWASNQFAVWIEDMDGNYVCTLYATRWTAAGGYRTRPDSIFVWVEASDLASKPRADVDAISGATPRTGNQSFTWDLTDADGNTVSAGDYMFFVEGTLRWRNYVLYSGVITLGDEPATVIADAEFVYAASDGQAALTSASTENAMIGAVTAKFTPVAVN